MCWAAILVYLVPKGTSGVKDALNKQDLAKILKVRFIHMMMSIHALYEQGLP